MYALVLAVQCFWEIVNFECILPALETGTLVDFQLWAGGFALAFLLLLLHLDIVFLLLFLIGMHILAAFYHQFIAKII